MVGITGVCMCDEVLVQLKNEDNSVYKHPPV